MKNYLETLEPLLSAKSDFKDVKRFHSEINIVFHNEEAKQYDKLHAEMWKSLPYQYQFIFGDIERYLKGKVGLRLLDIGCGTGLATELLLNAGLNEAISDIFLLDTSSVMLSRARIRSKKWKKRVHFIHDELNQLTGVYDVMLVSSVLHHIPDLRDFLTLIDRLQNEGCLLITIHDPCSEAMMTQTYYDRCTEFNEILSQKKPAISFSSRLRNKIIHTLGLPSYIDHVNRILIEKKVIHESLTAKELWSITDIHVEGLPFSANDGVSWQLLENNLINYSLVKFRTYCFFGTLSSNLTPDYQEKERRLSLAEDLNGRNFMSIWLKQSNR